jgi:hypothetical protein
MSQAITMPLLGHHTALKFSGKPRELRHFFDKLELLKDNCTLTKRPDNEGLKKWARRYIDIDMADLWVGLPGYNATKNVTWTNYKKEITKLYPGADLERRYEVSDLDKVIGATVRQGIRNRQDWGDYFREYKVISSYLKGKIGLENKK